MRKAVRRRSRLLKPLDGLSSTPSLLPVARLPAGGGGGRPLGRRTRSSSRSFWLQRERTRRQAAGSRANASVLRRLGLITSSPLLTWP